MRSYRHIRLAILFVLLAAAAAFGQEEDQSDSASQKPQINEIGWQIPGSNHFDFTKPRKLKVIDGTEVYFQVLLHMEKEEPIVDVDGNELSIEDAKEKDRLFIVREVVAYTLDDRIFAYSVSLVPVAIEHNVRVYAGAMYNPCFYDEDGNGLFESRYSHLRSVKLPQYRANKP